MAHPVAIAVRACRAPLREVADVPSWSLDDDETGETLAEITALRAQLDEVEARLLAHAETLELPSRTGARSLQAWYARHTRLSRPEAARRVGLARALAVHDQTRQAMARGEAHAEQAAVITDAVAVLDHQRDQAEKHLLTEAAHHDADALRRLGQRILEVVDPARADEHEARLLRDQEQRARRATRFSMRDDGDGTVHGRFTLPAAQAAMLQKALCALAAPKHVRATDGAGSYDWQRPTSERLGRAFCEYVERYPTDRLPHQCGVNATVVVTMPVSTLVGGLQAARLDTGDSLSPGEARRLACEAGLVPAVLDGRSRVLDLGRKTRLHSASQRLALTLEQPTCQHPSCDTPAAYCHVHHELPWSSGGTTDLANARLLCPFHHHQAHRPTGDARNHPLRT